MVTLLLAGLAQAVMRQHFDPVDIVTEVVNRADISEHVWDESYDPFSKVIEVFIQRLRRKVDDSHALKLIHTRRGAGYLLTRLRSIREGERWQFLIPSEDFELAPLQQQLKGQAREGAAHAARDQAGQGFADGRDVPVDVALEREHVGQRHAERDDLRAGRDERRRRDLDGVRVDRADEAEPDRVAAHPQRPEPDHDRTGAIEQVKGYLCIEYRLSDALEGKKL